ncbi:hypothetical protein CFI00_08355 [Nocardioides sp. S5]|nr:hypothetical protein CFI00_08355 [Nocardioides sp. S5]
MTIESADQDTLGRRHLASRTAELVMETHSWESSVVLALIGSWGGGKSSALQMTINELGQRGRNWKVVRFTPWAAADTGGVLSEFYAAIASALPEKKFEKFRSGLADLVEVSAPSATLVPYGGSSIKGGATWFSKWLRRQKPWEKAFKEASYELLQQQTPLLVVADDIDRLQGEELLGFLKVIRLLGRFPGISYLLAYDERSLNRTLLQTATGVEDRDGSHAFLEKFVQYPIYLPALLPGQVLRLIDDSLEEALRGTAHTISAQDGRLAVMDHVWSNYLDTPRAIKRFGAQVKLLLPLHTPDEVDVTDLVLLTLLRLRFPRVYEALPARKSRLTGGDAATFDWKGLVDESTLSEADHPAAREIVGALFPNTMFTGGSRAERPKVSHHQYFDRYFIHNIPDDDVPDYEVWRALEAASAGDAGPLSHLLTTEVSDKVDTAISKLWSFSIQGDPASSADVRLLAGVMSQIADLEGRTTGLSDRRQRVSRWAADLLERLPSEVSATSVSTALRACPELPLVADILWLASGDEEKLPEGVKESRTELGADVLEALVAHLIKGDAAPLDHSGPTLSRYLAHFAAGIAAPRLKAGVGREFSAADYASRFVWLSYTIGNRPIAALDSFATESFRLLTDFHDVFFDLEMIDDVDQHDVSWENRKAFAQGRARRLP